jgi:site-specific DNA recombinase
MQASSLAPSTPCSRRKASGFSPALRRRPAHAALVSEADFIAAQAAAARPGRAGGTSLPAGRAARLREVRTRLETAWSDRRPAYRCRHGRTSATGPGPG